MHKNWYRFSHLCSSYVTGMRTVSLPTARHGCLFYSFPAVFWRTGSDTFALSSSRDCHRLSGNFLRVFCKTRVTDRGAMCVLVAACSFYEITWRISTKFGTGVCVGRCWANWFLFTLDNIIPTFHEAQIQLTSFLKNGWFCIKKTEWAYRVLMGKPEGRRPLWRPRRRWEDNIKMDFREVV